MKITQFLWRAFPVSLIVFLLVAQTSCERENSPGPNTKADTTTYYGPDKSFSQGTARSWIEMTNDTVPVAIGLSIPAAAAASLPNQNMMFELELPPQAQSTLYKTIGLDWGPQGHPPGIYQHPHFDVHFYMIDNDVRNAIAYEAAHQHDTIMFDSLYMPPTYVSTMEAIPAMGVHWIDVTSPEIAEGAHFTKTFIIGAYNNEVIFHEPMVTLHYLQGLSPDAAVVTPIAQPQRVKKSGYYPQSYTILFDPARGEYNISLTDFIYKEAS